jgi:hypothetical protein
LAGCRSPSCQPTRTSARPAADDLGFAAVADRVGIPDWHATILHLLGLDHLTLAVDHGGLPERLTGVEPARVVTEILT